MHQPPISAEVLRKEIYVEDVLLGGRSIFEASAKQQSLKKLLQLTGFLLRRHLSGEPKVLSSVPIEDLASNNKSFWDTENFSVLGFLCQLVKDVFTSAELQLRQLQS